VNARTIEYRPALDGLRAWAVLAVVLYHAGATSSLPSLAPGGFLGVSVFFTLSGYLVTTLLVRKSSSPTGLDLPDFWARRLRRLAPVATVVVAATVLMSSRFWSGMRWTDAASALLGWANWNVIASGEDDLIRTIVGPLGPFWSLSVEEQFYVVLAIAVVVSWRTSRPVRTLSWFVAIGWISSLLVQILVPGPEYRLEFGTDSRGSELLAGCGLALLLHVSPTWTRRHSSRLAVAGPVAAAVLVGLALTTDYDPPWLLHGGYAAVSLVSATLVASLLVPSPLTRFLATAPTVAIGRLSYSWYVVHWPTILVLSPDRTGLDRWPLVVLKVAVSCALAFALHVVVEQPLRGLRVTPTATWTAWLAATTVVLALALVLL
jgi:peptidoglycan/LPS O-acetylase OafA/YrhL